jgi:outer membrane immunogenic protein
MKKLLIGSAMSLVMVAGASAADLRATNWTGFYVGGNAGYTWSASNTLTNTGTDTAGFGLGGALADGAIPSQESLKSNGFIGGLQAGYNRQAGKWVYGVEADIQWANAKDSFATTLSTFTFADPILTTASRQLDWLGTVRGRLGLTVTPTMLLYGTGGLAYGRRETSLGVFDQLASPPALATGTSVKTSIGWTIGAGVEYAVAAHWSAKVEYLYYDLGSNDVTIDYPYSTNLGPITDNSTLTAHSRDNGSIVRGGLNYKF